MSFNLVGKIDLINWSKKIETPSTYVKIIHINKILDELTSKDLFQYSRCSLNAFS